jgi:pentatricopeptide repeat protein
MKRFSIGLFAFFLLTQPVDLFAREGVVKGSYVNVRSDSNFTAPIIGKKMRGQKYTIETENQGWMKVRFQDGTEGFVFETLTEKQKLPEKPKDVTASMPTLPAIPTLLASAAKDLKKPPKKATDTAKIDGKTPDKKDPGKDGKTGKDAKAGKDGKDPKGMVGTPDATASSAKILAGSKSPEEYYNEAIDLFEKKKYPEALEANRMALLQAPKNAEIYNNMANCYFKMGKIDEALKNWKEALSLSPKSAKICNNIGIAYYQTEDNEKAIEYYKKAILFEPEFPDPFYNLASVYGYKGLFKEALEHYKKYLAFSIDPTMKQLTEERIEYCEKQIAGLPKKADKK